MRVVLIGGIEGHERCNSFQTGYAVYSPFGLCPALLANGLKSGLGGVLILVRNNEKKEIVIIGRMDNSDHSYDIVNRIYGRNGLIPTIPTGMSGGTFPKITDRRNEMKENLKPEDFGIRKITPREAWRLMGYKDEDYEAAASVNSKSQLYKQAGNAIVKQVLMAIFLQMNLKGKKTWNEMTVEEREKLVRGSSYGKVQE